MSTQPAAPSALSPDAPVSIDRTPVAPVWHTVVFIVGTLALTTLQARQTPKAATLNLPTRVPVYVVMIAFELILLAYVWGLGLRPAGKTLRDIIGGKWNTARDFWIDVGIALVFWMAVAGILLAMGLLLGNNNEAKEALRLLAPRTLEEIVAWVALSVTAGFCEELIFRGYLQRQFLALSGNPGVAVVLQAIVFGSAHLYQGWKGALTITVYGALFGTLAAWRKSLRPGMIQHAAQDSYAGIFIGIGMRLHRF